MMDRDLTKQLVDSIRTGLPAVLKTLCNIDITMIRSHAADSCKLQDHVAAKVQVDSQNLHGKLIVSFEKRLFLKLVSKVFDEEATEITKENEDSVAEVTNMLLGQIKAEFLGKLPSFAMTIPTPLRNSDSDVQSKQRRLCMEFEGPSGSATVYFIPEARANAEQAQQEPT